MVGLHHLSCVPAFCTGVLLAWSGSALAQGDLIFQDDFESGDVSAWSSSVGYPACPSGTPVSGALAGDLGPAPGGAYNEITCVEIRNDRAFDRSGETAYSSIPLPESLGLLTTDELALIGPGGRRLAAQFEVISRWGGTVDDAALPIRWLETVVQPAIAADETVAYSLRRYVSLPAASDPFAATIAPQGADWVVDTGLATFVLGPTNPALFDSISIDLDDDGTGRTGIYAHSAGAGPRLTFGAGTTTTPAVDVGGFRIIETGPVKVVVALSGHLLAAGGASLCEDPGNYSYERFGYTAVATFSRASRDVRLEVEVRNECSDASGGPWTDQSVTIDEAAWQFPFAMTPSNSYFAGSGTLGSSPPGFTGLTLVEQQKGAGTPSWLRRARILLDATVQESGEFFDRPLVAVADSTVIVAAQMPWMRYREPQALAVSNATVALRFIGESLVVGEGKGLWSHALLSLYPTQLANARTVAGHLDSVRDRGLVSLERGLLARAPLESVNRAAVFASMGTAASSPIKTEYLTRMNQYHDETVRAGGQWDRAKTYGSQLWPDVQFDMWSVDWENPYYNDVQHNYWNPSGAELLEYLRSGAPKWVWEFALPQSWLQTHTAYLNIGEETHGNRSGSAVTNGGCGEGGWHRNGDDPDGGFCGWGSDDYDYDRGMHLAYVLRPTIGMRDRFGQSGRMVVDRYNIPWANQGDREQFVNQVDLTRQVLQHFEHLANCAEFVPGQRGQDCHDRLVEVMTELAADNLAPGIMCQADIPDPNSCRQPEQFLQCAMMYGYLYRYYRNYGDAGGNLRDALVTTATNLYAYGLAKQPDGVSIDVDVDWAAQLQCSLTAGGTQVTDCTWLQVDSSNLLGHNKPHTMALLLMAHDLDPSIGLCEIAKTALDNPNITVGWGDMVGNDSGWFKGANQMMQSMAFTVGLYDVCSDP